MSAYELELLDSRTSSTVRVALAGELDLTNARELEERLLESVEDSSQLVVDVNRVVFMDSAALHVLFRIARRLGEGGLTVVVDPGAPIERALSIVGAHEAMAVVTTAGALGTDDSARFPPVPNG